MHVFNVNGVYGAGVHEETWLLGDQCLFQPVRPLLRLQINFFIIIIIILDSNEASYVLLPYVVQS